MTFPFLVIISPSPRTVVLAIVFYCLDHSKNVYDDDGILFTSQLLSMDAELTAEPT